MHARHLHDLKEVGVVLVKLEVEGQRVKRLDEALSAHLAQALRLRRRLALALLFGRLGFWGFRFGQVKQPDSGDEGVFGLLVALEEI